MAKGNIDSVRAEPGKESGNGLKLKLLLKQLCTITALATCVVVNADQPTLYSSCSGCHGASGQGSAAINAPAIAGLDAAYLKRQLQAFAGGQRGKQDAYSEQMAAMKPLLNSAAITELSDYLSQLPPANQQASSVEKPNNIKQAFGQYQASCGGCHGAKAEGNSVFSAPALRGLSLDYMQRQLRHFGEKTRGNDSRYGRQMQLMAKVIEDDKQRRDVLAYITSLGLGSSPQPELKP